MEDMDDMMRGPDIDFLSLRLRRSKALDIVLRLPPLFLMDQLLLSDMGLNLFDDRQHFETNSSMTSQKPHFHFSPPPSEHTEANLSQHFNDSNLEEAYVMLYGNLHWVLLPHLVHLSVCLFFYLMAAFIVTLSTKQLLVFYTYLIATLCAPLSYACNRVMVHYMSSMIDDKSMMIAWLSSDLSYIGPTAQVILSNVILQLGIAGLLSTILWLHLSVNITERQVRWGISLSMLTPTILVWIFSFQLMRAVLIGSIVIPLTLTAYCLWQVFGAAFRSVILTVYTKRQFVANFGLNAFLETEWVRLRVPSLLRTFWLARFSQQLLVSLHVLSMNSWTFTSTETASKMAVDTMLDLARDLFTRGAETIIAVLGMTSVISTLCHYIGSFFYIILTSGSDSGQENEEEKSVASVSAVLFFVLALQTGLTSLEPDKRFSRLCKNLCLLITALFHFVHSMVNPVLMSLSASHNLNSKRHIRALGICVFLVLAPMVLMVSLWQYFSVGTWLLAVSAFCIEVVIKVAVTVSVYALFLYDARAKDGSWEGLDDAVYYVKAVGNSIEFCFAVFLFFNGGWILFFESGGTIRAIMMLIHAYCNIWLEAKTGWQTFMKRRTAVAKINSLPDATAEDLTTLDDVCAICYQEMQTAKITRCHHFFHSVCLRKWLYVQDTCPLCHTVMYGNIDGTQAAPPPPAEPEPEPIQVPEPEPEQIPAESTAVLSRDESSSSASIGLNESESLSSTDDEFEDDLIYASMESYSRQSDCDEETDFEEFALPGLSNGGAYRNHGGEGETRLRNNRNTS